MTDDAQEAHAAPKPPKPPKQPTSSINVATVTLSWLAVATATSYTVYRSTIAGQRGAALSRTTALGYVDAQVVSGVTYYYSVTASNAAGESAASAQAQADIPAVQPPPPPPPPPPPQPATIANFSVNPTSLPAGGGSVTVNATVQNATGGMTLNGNTIATLPATVQVSATTTLTLQATGPAGTTPATASATVTVQGVVPPSDFQTRRTAPGVVMSNGFDSDAEVGTEVDALATTFGPIRGSSPPNLLPVRDTAVKASGNSSLRFDIPTNTGSDPCGAWMSNFTQDLSTLFGANSHFYVQWRQRFSADFINTLFKGTDGNQQAGIKQMIVGTGNQAGLSPYDATSCTDIDVVAQTYYQHRFPILYNACGYYTGMYERIPGDFLLQNMLGSPFCLYTANNTQDTTVYGACVGWHPDEWMTFQVGIFIGTLNTATRTWDNSEVKFWIAREGQPSQLVLWWRPGVGDYFPLRTGDPAKNERFGKVWFTPYMTGNSDTVAHPTCSTWYDELIVSTNQIADPSSAPSWRSGLPVNQFSGIANTSLQTSGLAVPRAGESNPIVPWTGGTADGNNGIFYLFCPGGHTDSAYNGVLSINLQQNAPAWSVLIERSTVPNTPTSAQMDTINPPYYFDGHPASRHNYYNLVHIGARSILFAPTCSALWSASGRSAATGDAFNLTNNTFAAAGTMPDCQGGIGSPLPAVAKDPTTEDVYICGAVANIWAKWTESTNTWAQIFPAGSPVGYQNFPMLMDASRSSLVSIQGDGVIHKIAIPALTSSTVTLTGVSISIGQATYAGLVHDTDNDRYVLVDYLGEVFFINPDTGAVTSGVSTVAAEAPSPGSNNGVFGRLQYLSSVGGIIYVPTYAGNVYFMPTR